MSVRFSQSCPTCGRRVEIRAVLIGRTVACQHCGSEFTASDCDSLDGLPQREAELMQRVEAAIVRAEQRSTDSVSV